VRSQRLSVLREIAYLCAESRNPLYDAALGKRIRSEPPDLEKLLPAALLHKVLHTVISTVPSELSSTEKRTQLLNSMERRTRQDHVIRKFMVKEAAVIMRHLDAHNVQSLVMKGFASSLQLYNNPYTREYTDLDLLVHIEEKEKIIPILADIGWELDAKQRKLLKKDTSEQTTASPPNENHNTPDIHHLLFYHPENPFKIEVHNYLYGHTYSHTKQVFSHAETIEWEDLNYRTLSLLDHAIYIIEHGTRHQWVILHWLLDAAVIFSQQDESLHRSIREKMIESGYEKHLRLALQLTTALFTVTIPDVYTTLLRKKPPSARILKNYCLTYMNSSIGKRVSLMHSLRQTYQFKIILADNWRERLILLIGPFKPSQKDMDAFPLPSWLMFIHVILRPLFVIRRRLVRSFTK